MARQNYGLVYNKPLTNNTKNQSSLDSNNIGVRESGADSLVLGRVVRVNYVYNTVDVVTVKNTERVIKDSSSAGRFSAKLPVGFAGTLSNGYSYGQTVPINIGDLVLIGFVSSSKENPVVMNIYKDSEVASSIAPTDAISGNPEDSNLTRQAFESFTLYPSQTYDLTDGLGGYEHTFQGKSFIKVGNELGGGSPNDYGYNYDMLYRRTLRDRNIEPLVTTAPSFLFQHTGDNLSTITNFFISDKGDFRLSHIDKNDEITDRVGLVMSGLDTIKMSYQIGDKEYNSGLEDSIAEVGINEGKPTLTNGNHSLTLDKDEGVIVDGVSLSDVISGGGGDLGERLKTIEQNVKDLQDEVKDFKGVDIKNLQDTVDSLNKLVSDEIGPNYEQLLKDMDTVNGNVEEVLSTANEAKQVSDKVNQIINDAAGYEDATLLDRLNRIDASAKSLQEVANEVINARKSLTNPTESYNTIGDRFDTIQDELDKWVTDYSELKRKLDVFISQDWGTGIVAYVVAVTPSDSTTFKNGKGSTTLTATLYKGGFDWTSMIKDSGFLWTRKSNDQSGDLTWNNNHEQGSKSITITAEDLDYSAIFSVNVVVEGNIDN